MKRLLLFNLLFIHYLSISQVGIGNMDPNSHAQLDISAETKGVLIPRITLIDVMRADPFDDTVVDPIPESLLVYNTGNDPNVVAGYYYWYNNQWNKIVIVDDDFEVLLKSPWNKAGTTDTAERNDDDIYQNGKVGIGTSNITPRVWLDVRGDALINGLTVGRGKEDKLTNTAVGISALASNTTGINNVAVGYEALNKNEGGNNNIATGYQALYSNTTGFGNLATGHQALYSNTTGDANIATGHQALYSNTTGGANIATGFNALSSNTEGIANIAIGIDVLLWNNIGSYNIATGAGALFFNMTGSYNTAIGSHALNSNTEGNYNTAIGNQALVHNTEGDYNTAIGYHAGPSLEDNDLSNTIAIGYNAKVTDSNTIRLGNDEITHIYAAIPMITTSDRRWKENIKTIPLGLDFVNKVRPVEYIRKNNEKKTKEWGVIAQELQQTLANAGYHDAGVVQGDNTAENYLSVRYTDLMAPMIKAIQELAQQNEELKRKNDQMQVKTNQLQVENDKIIKQINEMEKMMQQFMIK